MAVRTKLNFYEVAKCGYYAADEHLFADVAALLGDLEKFVHIQGRELHETKLFSATEGASPILPVYCLYARPFGEHGDYLVVTWNQTPENDGRVPSVDPSAPTGSAQVDFTDLPRGNIPGYASYYWFIPSQNIFGIFRFGSRVKNGHPGLQKYLSEYLRKEAGFVQRAQNHQDEVAIDGYRARPGDELRQGVTPRFESAPLRGFSQLKFLRENRARIFRVIRKSEVNWEVEVERAVWKRGLDFLVGRDGQEVQALSSEAAGRKYRLEFDLSPSEAEFEAMVENFEQGARGDFENLGFVLSGESAKTYWLSDALLKAEMELDLRRIDDEIVEFDSLQEAISAARMDLIEKLLSE
ncbi:hypothetical protein [Bradymonas sediminis]|uniref:Uncharacterized protein n=1 Tax=Bradymonas sediminis TaxID=1548548 RepID=A0A2Z4FMW7_9DELT|nr:hypothetical protein [Bradymonas sediminis]AWV90180.1 hypothetical protein DN745_12890 [Bradymonas sediminis]TDP75852.1 hypothetical protein DFR33_103199 [Bradymonas sediminis]